MTALPFPAIADGPEDGPVVLLLHGFPQNKDAWRQVMPALAAAGFRSVAFDQRGYRPPRSRGPRAQYRLGALATDVFTVADALGAERFHVAGHDWGGAVAWHLAAEPRDRVATATVVATPHPRAFARSMAGSQAVRSLYMAAFQVPRLPEALLRRGGGRRLARMLVRSGLPHEHAAAYARAMAEEDALGGALAWYRSNGPRAALATGKARVPTLYVWPSGDVALGRRAAERTAAEVDAPYRFEVLDGCSHWVPETEPAALAALMIEHLSTHPA